jgi:hypothetical protein
MLDFVKNNIELQLKIQTYSALDLSVLLCDLELGQIGVSSSAPNSRAPGDQTQANVPWVEVAWRRHESSLELFFLLYPAVSGDEGQGVGFFLLFFLRFSISYEST